MRSSRSFLPALFFALASLLRGAQEPAPKAPGKDLAAPIDRERLQAAAESLRDAWFLVEQRGKAIGFHRIQVAFGAQGSIVVNDELVFLEKAGRIAVRSEVTTEGDLLRPRRVVCETRPGPSKEEKVMRGMAEFGKEEISLAIELFANTLGVPFDSPRKLKGAQKRPAGPILVQALVPLILTALPSSENGSGLGSFTLVEIPADVDRLIAIKRDRRLEIESLPEGVRKVSIRTASERTLAATVRFDPSGKISRIEMEAFTERRAAPEEVRKAIPQAFPEKSP